MIKEILLPIPKDLVQRILGLPFLDSSFVSHLWTLHKVKTWETIARKVLTLPECIDLISFGVRGIAIEELLEVNARETEGHKLNVIPLMRFFLVCVPSPMLKDIVGLQIMLGHFLRDR